MQYAVLLSGRESIIENIEHYFAQQYFEKYFVQAIKEALYGELYPKDHIKLKISYNLDTGMVTVESIKAPSHIKTFFTSSAFYEYTQPVLQAIRWLSKLCLINQIYLQGDTEVNNLILNTKLLDTATGKLNYDVNEAKLDYLLLSILNVIDPNPSGLKKVVGFFRSVAPSHDDKNEIQKAIYRGFVDMEISKANIIDKISSISHVNKWLDAMGVYLTKTNRP